MDNVRLAAYNTVKIKARHKIRNFLGEQGAEGGTQE